MSAKKTFTPPAKEPCNCKAFCLEDLAKSGRYCKLEAAQAKTSSSVTSKDAP